ncbi:MAG: VanZ family protein [Bacteroidales bacterium]
MGNRKINLVLFVLWIGLMLFGILAPTDSLPNDIGFLSFIPYFDKIVHGGMFFGFAFLLFWLFVSKYSQKKSFFLTIVISIFFGIITEFLQLFLSAIIHRSFELIDFLADILGILFSMLLCYFIINKKQRSKKVKKYYSKKNR